MKKLAWLSIFLLVAEFEKTSADELIIKPPGGSHTKAAGKSIVFTCEVKDSKAAAAAAGGRSPNYQIKWFNKTNHEMVDRLGRVYIEDDGPTSKKLYIININAKDEGRYTCTAVINGQSKQQVVNLRQYEDIDFDHVPRIQHPRLHSNALIECRVGGSAIVSWRYKGQRINTGGRYTVEPNGLRISNITRSDDGDYVCMAQVESAGSYEERVITVVVHIPPNITTPMDQLIERVEGQEAEFICKASGFPSPTYEFRKENSVNPIQSVAGRITVNTDEGRLRITQLQHEDSGRYTCTAVNDVGKVTSSGTLKIYVHPKIQSFNGATENEGQRVTLRCESRGVPAPIMSFQKLHHGGRIPTDFVLGENVPNRGLLVRSPEAGRLELVINSLTPDDAGNYTCRSRNKIGFDESSAIVVVNYMPRFVDNHNTTGYIWPGKATNITCNVRSEPSPTVVWSKDSTPLTNNYTYTIYAAGLNNSLQVRMTEKEQSWLYAKYHCRVSNIYGEVVSTIELKKAVVPSYTLDIRETEVQPNKVVLRAGGSTENELLPIIGYRVQYLGKVQEFARNGDEIVIENLSPSTSYVIEISPRNEVGSGKATKKQIRTSSIRNPYPIEIISDQVGKAGYEYHIEWKTPSTGGTPIVSYEIKYRKSRLAGDGRGQTSPKAGDWTKIIYSDDPRQPIRGYNLTRLEPETSYEVEIRVKNERGWSDTSKLFSFMTVKATTAEIHTLRIKAGLVLAAVLVILLLILIIIIDIACCCSRRRGLTAYLCRKACGGRSRDGDKGKSLELGDGREILKNTSEETNHDNQATQHQSLPEVNNLEDTPTRQYKRSPPHGKSTTSDNREESKLLLANEDAGFADEIINTEEATPEDIKQQQQQQSVAINHRQELPEDTLDQFHGTAIGSEQTKEQPEQLIELDDGREKLQKQQPFLEFQEQQKLIDIDNEQQQLKLYEREQQALIEQQNKILEQQKEQQALLKQQNQILEQQKEQQELLEQQLIQYEEEQQKEQMQREKFEEQQKLMEEQKQELLEQQRKQFEEQQILEQKQYEMEQQQLEKQKLQYEEEEKQRQIEKQLLVEKHAEVDEVERQEILEEQQEFLKQQQQQYEEEKEQQKLLLEQQQQQQYDSELNEAAAAAINEAAMTAALDQAAIHEAGEHFSTSIDDLPPPPDDEGQ